MNKIIVVLILLTVGVVCEAVYGQRDGLIYPGDCASCPADFNCTDPQGLPCDEAYALKEVIDGLDLPDNPEFTRQNCSVETETITVKCECAPDLYDISVCHVVNIRTAALDLHGSIIHEKISVLSHLQNLDLAVNRLHCTIPDSMGKLKALKHLYFQNNFLQGSIPKSFGNLISLEILDLSRNMLTGEIPRELGGLSNLLKMNLEENQLKGNLPREFGSLINLEDLNVGSNYLDGGLDASYKQMSSIEIFDVGGNNLSGPIPEFMSKWKYLTKINLIGNNFEGNLPLDILKLSNLRYLRVSDLKNAEDFVFPEKANLTNIFEL